MSKEKLEEKFKDKLSDLIGESDYSAYPEAVDRVIEKMTQFISNNYHPNGGCVSKAEVRKFRQWVWDNQKVEAEICKDNITRIPHQKFITKLNQLTK